MLRRLWHVFTPQLKKIPFNAVQCFYTGEPYSPSGHFLLYLFLVHASYSSSILFRLHDPILEETHGAQNLSKEPELGGNLQGGNLKSLEEGSSKGPHGQLFSLLSSFTNLQQKLRCPPNHPDKSRRSLGILIQKIIPAISLGRKTRTEYQICFKD